MKSVRGKSFPYEKRGEKERNWYRYDQAQVNRIADVLEIMRDAVDIASSRIQEKKRGVGRSPDPAADIVKVMLMQAYLVMPNRVAQGFLRLFGEKLGISSEFSYKTKERGYDPERTEKLLDEVLSIMNEAGKESDAFPHTNTISGFFTTDDHSTGKLSMFPDIMAQTSVCCPKMEMMLGDTLYSNRKICSIVGGYGITTYFLLKTDASSVQRM